MEFHPRRKDKEVTDKAELRKILTTAKFMTIALSNDNRPYLVSLSYGYDERKNCLYFHCSKEGKKLEWMKSNSTTWGQILLDYGYSQGECDHLYASVHFLGKITLLSDLAEKQVAAECMMKQLDDKPESLISKLTSDRLTNVVMGRIDIQQLTGKKSKEVNL